VTKKTADIIPLATIREQRRAASRGGVLVNRLSPEETESAAADDAYYLTVAYYKLGYIDGRRGRPPQLISWEYYRGYLEGEAALNLQGQRK
jgi:hypothetical protein